MDLKSVGSLFTTGVKRLKIDSVTVSPARANDGRVFVKVHDDYFGTIHADGHLYVNPRHGLSVSTLDSVLDILEALDVEGPSFLARAGRASGNCCYCARTLTDPNSIQWGYGPICADYHGLPHGEYNAA